MKGRLLVCAFLHLCIPAFLPLSAAAAEHYALVVTGAAGGDSYARQYATWQKTFVNTLRESFQYPAEHIIVLADTETDGVGHATREGVRAAIADLRGRATPDDVILVLLIGHGTGMDSDEAKFNLVGPDLSAAEWAELLEPLAGRLVFVDAASGSFPFLERLSGRGRIIVTANDSIVQQYETVFPSFFVNAFTAAEADADKNGKVSLWEAFAYASAAVRRWYEEKGQLPTERALLDDNGDGVGRDADSPGPDGQAAQVTYLQPGRKIPDTENPERAALLRRRAQLESDLEMLRVRKPGMSPEDYETAMEKLLLELARIDRRLRTSS